MKMVSVAEAKARLSELVEQAQAGQAVCITRRGKPVARLSSIRSDRKPIRPADLAAVTSDMPFQPESAAEFVRAMRDTARY